MSSGVQSFIQGKNPRPASPAIQQQFRNRQDAALLKMPLKRGMNSSISKHTIAAPSALGYGSNGYVDPYQSYGQQPEPYGPPKSTYGQETYEPEQTTYGDQFDDTINSDFDKTITDSGSLNGRQASPNDAYGEGDKGSQYTDQFNPPRDNGYPQHHLTHKHSQVHLGSISDERQVELPTRSQAPTRFVKPHRDLEVRTTNDEHSKDHDGKKSKKRSHSVEYRPLGDKYDLPPPITSAADDLENVQDPESPTPANPSQRKGRLNSQIPATQATASKRDHAWEEKPNDYTDEELKSMKYADLANQSWETIPGYTGFTLAPQLRGPNVTLGDKISYYVLHENEYKRKGIPVSDRDDETPNFFAELSTAEWDEAGDWFLEKFGSLVTQLRQKRQEKRKLVADFEKKIQRRERAVSGKSDNLDREFQGMKKSGEEMLRGKMG